MSRLRSMPRPVLDGAFAEALVWWEPLDLDPARTLVHAAWSAWAQDWLTGHLPLPGEPTCVLAHDAVEAADVRWHPIGTRGEAAAWMDLRETAVAHIKQAMFGPEQRSAALTEGDGGIARVMASHACAALADALRDCLSLDANPGQANPPPGYFKPWSGSILVSSPSSSPVRHSLLLNAACVRAQLGPSARHRQAGTSDPQTQGPVTSLHEALADRMLPIQVELAHCELGLGMLESLRLGDVIQLPHRLDAPLLVSTRSHGPFCAAFLGRQAGSKAIELMRQPRPAECQSHFDHDAQEQA